MYDQIHGYSDKKSLLVPWWRVAQVNISVTTNGPRYVEAADLDGVGTLWGVGTQRRN